MQAKIFWGTEVDFFKDTTPMETIIELAPKLASAEKHIEF
jgi:hypothetical protein